MLNHVGKDMAGPRFQSTSIGLIRGAAILATWWNLACVHQEIPLWTVCDTGAEANTSILEGCPILLTECGIILNSCRHASLNISVVLLIISVIIHILGNIKFPEYSIFLWSRKYFDKLPLSRKIDCVSKLYYDPFLCFCDAECEEFFASWRRKRDNF